MLALGVVWQQRPRPPALDGERWFKVSLATLLRGQVEAEGGGPEDWEQRTARFVPYHPAGRWPERKVSNPVAASLPASALPGEIALLEGLAALEGPEERWARLYDHEVAREAVLQDPAELGPAYDPAALGPAASWASLAAWGAGEDRRFADEAMRAVGARWVLVEGSAERRPAPSVLDALAEELPAERRVRVAHQPLGEASVARAESELQRLADEGHDLVLVGEGEGVARLLRVLARNLAVRDRTYAVVGVGGVIGGRTDEATGPLSEAACRDWLEAWFAQRHLETEVVRLTPYFSVQWLDRGAWPPGVAGQPLQHARFPEPDAKGATATTVEVVDLGPLPADPDLPVAQVARALIAVVCAWVVSRR